MQLDMKFNLMKQQKTLCPKCGFAPTFQKQWSMDYVEECSPDSDCVWEDEDVKEHMHMNCPDCGFELVVPCLDYDDKIVEQFNNSVVQTPIITPKTFNPPARPLSTPVSLSNPTNHTPPVYKAPVDPWSVECTGCPCSTEKKEVSQ